MNKAILIDMGDTIINNYEIDYSKGLSCVYDKAINPIISKEEYIKYGIGILENLFIVRKEIEFRMQDYLRQVNEYLNLKFDISYEKIEEIFAFNSSKVKLVSNIELFLKHLKQKQYQIIVLSNTSFSKNIIVKTLGELCQYFDDIIVSSDYSFRKPHFAFFNVGISRLNVGKENIYYIGNSYYYDVYGSYNAGIKSIWFNEQNEMIDHTLKCEYKEIKSYTQLIDEDF